MLPLWGLSDLQHFQLDIRRIFPFPASSIKLVASEKLFFFTVNQAPCSLTPSPLSSFFLNPCCQRHIFWNFLADGWPELQLPEELGGPGSGVSAEPGIELTVFFSPPLVLPEECILVSGRQIFLILTHTAKRGDLPMALPRILSPRETKTLGPRSHRPPVPTHSHLFQSGCRSRERRLNRLLRAGRGPLPL